jgi:hypothetical protein
MSLKPIYFRNQQARAVASTNDPQFVASLEAMGFEQCSHEDFLTARWLTWDDSTLIEIEGDELKKKRAKKGKVNDG